MRGCTILTVFPFHRDFLHAGCVYDRKPSLILLDDKRAIKGNQIIYPLEPLSH